MQTIIIQTKANKSVLDAIKTLILASDKSEDYGDELSKDDTQDLLNTYELYKQGKLEFMSDDEFKGDLVKKGYEWR